MILLCALGAALAADPVALPEGPPPGSTPSAADDARARELYDNGALLYEEGRYEDAIAAWAEAYRLSGRPLLLFNMANAAERIGRYDEAMALLSRYRAFAPADEREILDRRIRNIESRLAEAPSPAATTTSAPPPASDPDDGGRRVRVLPLVLGGVGVVGIGTGTALGVTALGARSAAAEDCLQVGESVWCTDDAAGALRADRSASLGADIAFGVGAAGVVGAVVTAVLPGRATATGGWMPGGGGWIAVRGGF